MGYGIMRTLCQESDNRIIIQKANQYETVVENQLEHNPLVALKTRNFAQYS
jgi:hypothetical protein